MEKSYFLRSATMSSEGQRTKQSTPSTSTAQTSTPTPEGTGEPESAFTLADVMRSIRESEVRVCAKLDGLQHNLDQIKTKVDDLEAAVDFNASKVDIIEKEKLPQIESDLRKEVDQLRTKLIESEIYQRKNNLLFYGVKMEQGENVYVVIRHVFTLLGLSKEEAEAVCLINVHRLPQRHSQEGVPHPIIAKFVYMSQRNRVLAAFEERAYKKRVATDASTGNTTGVEWRYPPVTQETSRLTVRTDLPPALKATRSELAKVAYKLRKEKKLSTKITVVRAKVVLFYREKGTQKWEIHKE